MLQSRGGTFHSAAPFSCPVASLPLHSAVSKNFRLPHLEIAKKCLGIWEEVFPRQCIAGGPGWVSWKGFWKISAGPVRKSSKNVSVSEGRFFKKICGCRLHLHRFSGGIWGGNAGAGNSRGAFSEKFPSSHPSFPSAFLVVYERVMLEPEMAGAHFLHSLR